MSVNACFQLEFLRDCREIPSSLQHEILTVRNISTSNPDTKRRKNSGAAKRFRLKYRPMPKITFLGAAGTVTGSKYLIEAEGKRLLVDCGLFEGSKELRQRNWERLAVDPATIDWVILTHAHIDHTGYIPRLVRNGFRGPIYSNAATRELCTLLLPDSAHLQEEDARYAAKKGYSRHKPPLPLYTVAESQTALGQFREIPRADTFQISPQFSVRPHDAGHILGSSWLELTITENGKRTLVVFSGDVGRYDQPILKDPESPSHADILLCEVNLRRSRPSRGLCRGRTCGRD